MSDILRLVKAIEGGDYLAILPLIDALNENHDPRYYEVISLVGYMFNVTDTDVEDLDWHRARSYRLGESIVRMFQFDAWLHAKKIQTHLTMLSKLAREYVPETMLVPEAGAGEVGGLADALQQPTNQDIVDRLNAIAGDLQLLREYVGADRA